MDNYPINAPVPGGFPYAQPQRIAPFTKEEIKSFRHKAEKPLYVTMVIINILVILFAIGCVVAALNDKGPLSGETGREISEQLDKEEGRAVVIQDGPYDYEENTNRLILEVIAILIALPIVLMVMVYFYYAQYRANAVRITRTNFPDIYQCVEEYAQRLGLKETPKVYIAKQNGIMNAFTAYILRRQYIVIMTDLFEVAYLEHHDLDSIKFIIAHEMTHIKLRHATFSYQLSILFGNYIPLLPNTLSRAREYSCDRVAQHLSGVSGVEPMLALVVGKHLYKKIDIEDYVNHCHEVRGFFVFIYNLMATHPIMPKRIQALLNDHGSGRLIF